MGWWLYNLLFVVVALAYAPALTLHMWRRRGYGHDAAQRFGCYAPAVRARLAAKPRVWVHAVSVGEGQIARALIRAWQARDPGLAFVLTTTTPTGHAAAARDLPPDTELLRFPVDFPFAMRRALAALRPRAVVLIERELWPNLIRLADAQGVPVVVVNGRISPRSHARARRLPALFRAMGRRIRLVCAQSDVEARRIVELGVAADRVRVMGSVKYDVSLAGLDAGADATPLLRACGVAADRVVWVAGSTWPGEETLLLAQYSRLRTRHPALFLVLAPRHVERAAELDAAIVAAGLRGVRRSSLGAGTPGAGTPPDVLLVDTTGELVALYGVADVVFVGKSLTQQGGQNVIEPAALGRATIVGPSMQNFPQVMEELLAAEAVVQVRDAAALEAAVDRLAGDPAARDALGARAAQAVRARAGAIARTVDALREVMATAETDAGGTSPSPGGRGWG